MLQLRLLMAVKHDTYIFLNITLPCIFKVFLVVYKIFENRKWNTHIRNSHTHTTASNTAPQKQYLTRFTFHNFVTTNCMYKQVECVLGDLFPTHPLTRQCCIQEHWVLDYLTETDSVERKQTTSLLLVPKDAKTHRIKQDLSQTLKFMYIDY